MDVFSMTATFGRGFQRESLVCMHCVCVCASCVSFVCTCIVYVCIFTVYTVYIPGEPLASSTTSKWPAFSLYLSPMLLLATLSDWRRRPATARVRRRESFGHEACFLVVVVAVVSATIDESIPVVIHD